MTIELKQYLIQDRQWRREHRIAHARYQLTMAKSTGEADYWGSVLEANQTARGPP